MTRSLAALGRTLMVLSLCTAVGLHWAALQSVAWAGMLLTYSRSAPLSEAVSKTFDGKHPCPLCRAISKASRSDKKHEVQQTVCKIDLFCKAAVALLFPPAPLPDREMFAIQYFGRVDSPPVPPPRCA